MEFAFDETGQMYFIVEDPITHAPVAEAEDILLYPKESDYLGVAAAPYIIAKNPEDNAINITYHEEVEDVVQP